MAPHVVPAGLIAPNGTVGQWRVGDKVCMPMNCGVKGSDFAKP